MVREWYAITDDEAKVLAKVPGLVWEHGHWRCHRTHLALLGRQVDAPAFDPPVLPFKLRPWQPEMVAMMSTRRAVLCTDEMRVGKAQPLTAKVLTPSGWRAMGDLRVGDEIVDPDGGVAQVEAIYPQGVKPVYRVKFCDGAATECCDEHLWAVQTAIGKWDDRALQVRSLQSMRDNLWMPTESRTWGRGNRRFFVPLTQPIEFVHPATLPLDPYLVGALLGDGCITGDSPRFSCAEDEILDRVCSALPDGVRVVPGSGVDYGLTVEGGCRTRTNPLTERLRLLGLWGTDSFTKFIPRMYRRAPAAARLELLRGLMDTDGDVTERSITSFNTTSKQLCADVLELIRSLGGFASVSTSRKTFTYKDEKRTGAVAYRLHIRMPVNPFHLVRKVDRWRVGPLARGIDSAELIGDRACQCIKVSSKRSLYITDDYIVTHNTVETVAAWNPAAEQLCIVAPLAAHPNWLHWIRMRLGHGGDISVLEGRTFEPEALKAQVVLLHYEILGAWHALDYRPHLLVFDEMHLLSNAGALRTQVAMSLSTQARRVIGLTGSPLWNHPAGLHAILSCLSPGAWGSQADFIMRYAGGERGRYGVKAARPTNMDEFHARCEEVVFGRTWQDIGIDPGHVVRTVEEVPVSWDEAREIDLRLAEVMSKTTKGGRLAAATKARKLLGDLKMKRALELAVEFEGALVIWCWHVGIAKAIATLLVGETTRSVWTVTGTDTAKNRQGKLEEWRSAPRGILVATISVAQVGIDLSHAAKCIFAELDFTPANIAQAEMRTFSPDRPMEVVYVATTHAADMAVVGALCRKQADGDALGLRAAEGAVAVLGELFGVSEKPDLERLFNSICTPIGSLDA